MSRARAARRAAAFGGGGVVGVGAGMLGVLATQARLARRWIGPPDEAPPPVDGVWQSDGSWVPPSLDESREIRLAILGDSSAAGLGVAPAASPGAQLAIAVARVFDRPVSLRNAAFVGAQSGDLDAQLTHLADFAPQVAVIMVGANDVTHRVLIRDSAMHLDAALERLSAAGVAAVVATCPDLGTVQPIQHPLRLVCRTWSRSLARAQAHVTEARGAVAVRLGDVLGPEFATRPHEMFGPDRFHPSAAGYAAAADVMAPAVVAAMARQLGAWATDAPPVTTPGIG